MPILLSLLLCASQQIGGEWETLYQIQGTIAGNEWGRDVAHAGDVNGDGYDDYLVAAHNSDRFGFNYGGEVTVFSGLDGSILLEIQPTENFMHLGLAMDSLGDVDGDGMSDLLIGAHGANNPSGVNSGAAFVYSGATGLRLHSFYGTGSSDWFGAAVANIGDIDGDGINDLIIGAQKAGSGGVDSRGAALVYSGATGALLHHFIGGGKFHFMGYAVGTPGDVDNDGVNDIIVNTRRYLASGSFDAGAVNVYSGATGALFYQLRGEVRGDFFGNSMCAAGDIDLDGVDDFLVGAYTTRINGLFEIGSVYAFSGIDGSIILQVDGTQQGQQFGYELQQVGDTNGDGKDEVLISSIRKDVRGKINAGAAELYSFPSAVPLHRFNGQVKQGLFGANLAGGGDVDGDGLADLIIGASTEHFGVGSVYVYSLNPMMKASAKTISQSAGGTVTFDPDFDSSLAGFDYGVLISASGLGATHFHKGFVSLGLDALFQRTASGQTLTQMPNGFGMLDAAGDAQVDFTLPPNSPLALVGSTYWFASAVLDSNLVELEATSVALPLTITP